MTRAAAEQRLTEPDKDERGTRQRRERHTTMRERHDEARETRMSSRTSPQARHTERLTRKKSGGLTHTRRTDAHKEG